MSFAFINQKNQYLFLKFIQNINVNMNEKRSNFLYPSFFINIVVFFYCRETAEPYANNHSYSFSIGAIDFKPRFNHSHFSTGDSIMDKPIHLLYIFMIDIIFWVKSLDLTSNFHREVIFGDKAFYVINT